MPLLSLRKVCAFALLSTSMILGCNKQSDSGRTANSDCR
jgi:hypothetical protein